MKSIKYILLMVGILGVDIITKMLVVKNMVYKQSIEVIKDFFYITYAKNTGGAFSFMTGQVPFIILFTCVILFFIIVYLRSNELSKIEGIAYSMLVGGALGNFLDRILYGYVIDFADIYIFGYDYPVFNIADIFIVVGVVIILVISMKKESSDKDGNKS